MAKRPKVSITRQKLYDRLWPGEMSYGGFHSGNDLTILFITRNKIASYGNRSQVEVLLVSRIGPKNPLDNIICYT